MSVADRAFFSLEVATKLVREGADFRHFDDRETGVVLHTMPTVYGEMLVQIAMDFPGLPNVNALTLTNIRFWYNGLRGTLKARTKRT